MKPQQDYSANFYRQHAERYAEVAHGYLQSVYIRSSHPALKSDNDLIDRLKQLAPGKRGLDAGCGAGARDVFQLWREGWDIVGIDVIEENIATARARHPEIADRVSVADLSGPFPFPNESFDFAMCNAVIQHIEPDAVLEVTLPELARVLKKDGVLQLMFKNGSGVLSVYDKDYDAQRSFRLYDEHELFGVLRAHDMELVEADAPDQLGGLLYFTDPKPADHCAFFARKRE